VTYHGGPEVRIECLEGTLKIIHFQHPSPGQGCQPLNQAAGQAAHGPIQTGLEHLQGLVNNLGQPVPGSYRSLCEKLPHRIWNI